MFNGRKILGLIPARGGSKGIKGKNIILFAGKPLIAWTIEASLGSKYVDSTIVTTDSTDIANTAEQYGAEVPFMRPAELAGDKAKTVEAVIHAINTLSTQGRHYDVLVLLQPTSPLRTSEDIDGAVEAFFRAGEKGTAAISSVNESPLLIRCLNDKGEMTSLLNVNSTCRRQDMPEYYRVNGSIYINRISEICVDTSFNDNPVPFIMKKANSVDIDEPEDIILAEYYLSKTE